MCAKKSYFPASEEVMDFALEANARFDAMKRAEEVWSQIHAKGSEDQLEDIDLVIGSFHRMEQARGDFDFWSDMTGVQLAIEKQLPVIGAAE